MKQFTWLIIALLMLAACSKEETKPQPACMTCQTDVFYWQESQPSQTYVESVTTYCDDKWRAVDGKVVETGGHTASGNWTKRKTTHCH